MSAFLFLLCVFLFVKDIGSAELFTQYTLLTVVGFSLFGLITALNLFDKVDLEIVVLNVASIVIVFAFINLFIITFFPEPFVVIAGLTGLPVQDFARLYSRIILPFGNPSQLGLVAACSAIAILSFEKSVFRVLLVLFLSVTILYTFSNSILIPLFLIGTAAYVRKILQHPAGLVYSILVGLVCSFLVIVALYFEISISGRNSINILESGSRHLMLRVQTLQEISNLGVTNILFGVGLGQSRFFIDGSYSFTVLLTQLFEGGVLLVFIQLMYFLILARRCVKFNSWAIWWLVFLASFMYQINNDISFYIYPLICILAIERTHGQYFSQSGKSKGGGPQKYF